VTTVNFYFYLQNRLIKTSQTAGQWYSGTSPYYFLSKSLFPRSLTSSTYSHFFLKSSLTLTYCLNRTLTSFSNPLSFLLTVSIPLSLLSQILSHFLSHLSPQPHSYFFLKPSLTSCLGLTLTPLSLYHSLPSLYLTLPLSLNHVSQPFIPFP
jgi:hypothetical protein